MNITERVLRQLIKEEIKKIVEGPYEKFPWQKRSAWPGERSAEEDEYLQKVERDALASDRRKRKKEIAASGLSFGDTSFEEEIEDLRSEIEYADVSSFVEFKFDDEDETFTAADLQALARNEMHTMTGNSNALPTPDVLKKTKKELLSYGLKFIPRERQRTVRGMTSSPHGTHPFAGTGGGGSGFSNAGLRLGSGPGAIGGKTSWSSGQQGSLSMGSKRR